MKRGILYGIGAYALWGLFPAYWKMLQHVPAAQLIAHRVFWSFTLLTLFIVLSGRKEQFLQKVKQRRVLLIYLAAAVLIGINWSVYVWAVNAGYIVESSLGYFINPLINVLLGVVFLRERLRPLQWLPIALAAAGVVYLTVSYGKLPWIALTLACSFGIYGLVKKTAPLNSVNGLTLETGYLLLPAIGVLLTAEFNGTGAFLHTGLRADLLMFGAGFATTIPLLMFASAAQRIPLSMMGILQYLAPTLQLLLGVLVYHEPFTRTQWVGFGAVWLALAIYSIEGFYHRYQTRYTRDQASV
jgi:chloramphenicol-sensitive protein RarD